MSFFASRWVERPATSPSSRRPARRASAPPAWPRASSPSGALDVGLLVSDAPDDGQRRALHALGRARRAGAAHARSAASSTRCARWWSTPATPTRPPAGAGSTPRRKVQGAGAMAAGVPEDAGRGRLDRRDRRAAAGRRGRGGHRRGARASSPRTATPRSPRRSGPPTRSPSASSLEVELPSGTRAPQRAGQGRGHDLAGLRDDALLRADRRRARARDRRPAARRDASSARSTASASTASSRPTTR